MARSRSIGTTPAVPLIARTGTVAFQLQTATVGTWSRVTTFPPGSWGSAISSGGVGSETLVEQTTTATSPEAWISRQGEATIIGRILPSPRRPGETAQMIRPSRNGSTYHRVGWKPRQST